MKEEVIFIYCLADCVVHAVSFADNPRSLLKGSKIYGDRAYNDSHYEELLEKGYGINLIPKRKQKSRRKHSSEDECFLLHHRGRIETTFSEIKMLMPRSIQARTAKGFLLKVLFFILGVTVKDTLKETLSAA